MSILDNARYTELGKKAEAKQLANDTINAVAPKIAEDTLKRYGPAIERLAINKYGPTIHNRAVNSTVMDLSNVLNNSGNGLSNLGLYR